jgi:hypothetical protein
MSRLDIASPEVSTPEQKVHHRAGIVGCWSELWTGGAREGPPPRQLVELPRFEQAIEGLGLYPGS